MFKRLVEAVIDFKWPLGFLFVLSVGITGYAVRGLQIDPTVETLFVKNSPEYRYYREYRERYGSDLVVAVAMSTPDLFTLRALKDLDKLTKMFQGYPQVERVLSLANVLDIRHKFLGVKMVPAMQGILKDDKPLGEFREKILGNELYVSNLVSEDGKVANILIYLKPHLKNRSAGSVFIRQLRRLLAEAEYPGAEFFIAGAPVEQNDFVSLIRRDQFRFIPMISVLLVLTTFLIYRSLTCTILAMSIVFTTLLWTLGVITLSGRELNLVTSLLAPVVMIISVVNAIHLMNLFFEIRQHHLSLHESVVLTIEQLGVPCLLTHFTTMLGFISLAFNAVPAINSFGLFAAMGTFFSFAVSMLLTPLLLPMLPYRVNSAHHNEQLFFNRVLIGFIERLEHRWKWLILFLSFASLVFAVLGIRRIEVDTNIVKQLKPDSRLAIATQFIDEHMTGVYYLGFVVRRTDGGDFADHDALSKIDEFKTYLESIPAITKVNSITTVLKKIHEAREDDKAAYKIPEDDDTLRRYLKGLAESEDPEIGTLISRDGKEVRLEARMKAVGTKEGTAVEETAREYIAKNLIPDFDCHITGSVVLLGKMAKDLVRNQMMSFGIAFASILVFIMLIFRSVRLGILAAIPNLLPILVVYGFMGFVGIELSTSTAMISSIVLGLVVDASIHFLHRFRHEFHKRHHYLQALHHTYRNVGQALVVATMILVVGFASSIFAELRPTIHFGILTSLTIFLALIFTLLALPLCLVMMKPFGPQRLFKGPN